MKRWLLLTLLGLVIGSLGIQCGGSGATAPRMSDAESMGVDESDEDGTEEMEDGALDDEDAEDAESDGFSERSSTSFAGRG